MKLSTRLQFTFGAAVFLALISLVSIIKGMENASITGIAGIMTILSAYIWSQTKRPHHEEISQPDDSNPDAPAETAAPTRRRGRTRPPVAVEPPTDQG